MKHRNLKLRIARTAGSVSAAFLLGGIMSGCTDDLLTGQPSWLGESIYQELERRGNFTETLKLINAQSEDYATVLRKTGSRTLFAANDEAWKEFYANNPWGVKSIEEMTEAQKRLIFKANMIKSAYLVELLGNLPATSSESDPEEGACLRRASSVSLMDSVPVVWKKDYPEVNPVRLDANTGAQVDYWSRLRDQDSALVMQDDGVAPMIHFMPKFMLYNRITSHDVEFMTNGDIKTNEGAFINGQPVTEADITCQNGYIHQVGGVPVPLDNMANVIANNPQFSIYKRLLDRFSYPHYDETLSKEYDRQYGTDGAKVYVKRYFNEHGRRTFDSRDQEDGGDKVTELLPYDPGWNRWVYETSNADVTFQTDAAVMVVPTDEAMLAYLEADGADLNARYKNAGPGPTAWDNAPDNVIKPLLVNTMLKNSTLKSAIPSLFGGINNAASEPMGVKEEDISRVHWACNGVVYQSDKVYVAPEYVSVYYPCIIRGTEDLRMTYTVINNDSKVQGGEGFYAYLNNMGAKYSFIIPTNNALQTYYDPVSYKRTASDGTSTAVAYKFEVNPEGKIAAKPYLVDWNELDASGRGTISEDVAENVTISNENSEGASKGDAFNHFKDIINSSLSVGLFNPQQKFYMSMNGSPIIVDWDGDKVKGVAGSFQYERGYFVPVTEVFDKSKQGNGVSYLVNDEPLMSTFVSPLGALTAEENADKFGTYAALVEGLDVVGTDDGSGHATMDRAIRSFNNYHYTIFVPKNESIQPLIDEHKLPTWDEIGDIDDCYATYVDQMTPEDSTFMSTELENMKTVLTNFVTYHMQDNSVYVEGEEHNNDVYESQCLDTLTKRFVKLYVNYQHGGKMTVRDVCGNVRTVDSDVNNLMTRQYYFNGGSLVGNACSQINLSSFIVIHQIDAPLYPGQNCFYDPDKFAKVMALVEKYNAMGEIEEDEENANPVKRHKR